MLFSFNFQNIYLGYPFTRLCQILKFSEGQTGCQCNQPSVKGKTYIRGSSSSSSFVVSLWRKQLTEFIPRARNTQFFGVRTIVVFSVSVVVTEPKLKFGGARVWRLSWNQQNVCTMVYKASLIFVLNDSLPSVPFFLIWTCEPRIFTASPPSFQSKNTAKFARFIESIWTYFQSSLRVSDVMSSIWSLNIRHNCRPLICTTTFNLCDQKCVKSYF